MTEKNSKLTLKMMFIIGVLFILLITVVSYVYINYKKYNELIVDKSINLVSLSELDNYALETDEFTVYLAPNGLKDIYKFETKLLHDLPLLKENNDIVYYYLGNIKDYSLKIEEFEAKYNSSKKIEVPSFITIKNQKIINQHCIICNDFDNNMASEYLNNINSGKLIEIDVDKLNQKILSKEKFIIYFGSPTCPHCLAFTPTLTKILEENKIVGYYLDMSKLSGISANLIYSKYNISGTPTVVFVDDGRIDKGRDNQDLQRIIGNKSEADIKTIFESNGYLMK